LEVEDRPSLRSQHGRPAYWRAFDIGSIYPLAPLSVLQSCRRWRKVPCPPEPKAMEESPLSPRAEGDGGRSLPPSVSEAGGRRQSHPTRRPPTREGDGGENNCPPAHFVGTPSP